MKKLLLLPILGIFFCCGNPSTQQGQLIDSGGIEPEPKAEAVLSDIGIKGKNLFEINCAACHIVDEKLIGPSLLHVNERREEAWLIQFIRNSQAMIKAGDPIAVKVYEENMKMVMSPNEHLTDEEIKQILVYISEFGREPEILPSK